jgi:hypothetical protein
VPASVDRLNAPNSESSTTVMNGARHFFMIC